MRMLSPFVTWSLVPPSLDCSSGLIPASGTFSRTLLKTATNPSTSCRESQLARVSPRPAANLRYINPPAAGRVVKPPRKSRKPVQTAITEDERENADGGRDDVGEDEAEMALYAAPQIPSLAHMLTKSPQTGKTLRGKAGSRFY